MNILKIMITGFFMFACAGLYAQSDTAYIKTSARCQECKERIEADLSFEKGVKSSSLNLDTKVLMVVYNPSKTSIEKIREAVAKVGYDADTVKANEKSFRKLPACCKNPDLMHKDK